MSLNSLMSADPAGADASTAIAEPGQPFSPGKTTDRDDPDAEAKAQIMGLVAVKGAVGVSRKEMMSVLRVSRPTVDVLIRSLKLKILRREKRKEFFGLPAGARRAAPANASDTPPVVAPVDAERERTWQMLAQATFLNAQTIERLVKQGFGNGNDLVY